MGQKECTFSLLSLSSTLDGTAALVAVLVVLGQVDGLSGVDMTIERNRSLLGRQPFERLRRISSELPANQTKAAVVSLAIVRRQVDRYWRVDCLYGSQ